MFNRAWLPTVAAAGLIFVAAFTAACGSSNPKPQMPAASAAVRHPARPRRSWRKPRLPIPLPF